MTRGGIEPIVQGLLDALPAGAADDLRGSDPAEAIERHFSPIGLERLPYVIRGGRCSTDGWYDAELDPTRPWIIYSRDGSTRRTRFTLAHELGHHLLRTAALHLLDAIDALAGDDVSEVEPIEETVCHRFAGRLLVPDEHLISVQSSGRIRPQQIKDVHDFGVASFEAISIAVAATLRHPGAVIVMRDSVSVGFCAASPTMGWLWWRRGSNVAPGGPLSRATTRPETAVEEIYRYDLGYARQMYCDTLPVIGGLGIAVLSDKPSDGRWATPTEEEPTWRSDIKFCEWCSTERDVGWCESCRGQLCRQCGRCACKKPVANESCPSCHLIKTRRPGATVCRDCEDG